MRYLDRIAVEPPFRLAARWYTAKFVKNLEARARWGVDPYPYYLFGMLEGAQLAKRLGERGMTAVEFGVAGGDGLLMMQHFACQIEMFVGVRINVIGFDSGNGLPAFIGDYRDHPDQWHSGAYTINTTYLNKRIDPSRTRLIIGDVRETVPFLLNHGNFLPLGFVAFDLDLYSSTKAALTIIGDSKRRMLRQTPLYFDDLDFLANHRWAGELLAIDEFNQVSKTVKIDRWYNVRDGKPFPEAHYWEKMFVAHDLEAISACT